jgi:glycine betaine/proline transport system permease protein
MWDHAMDTLSQVLVAIVISVLIALPLGMLAGRSNVAERIMRPFLDIAQVMPQFVYLLPVIFLFAIGRAAGVIACVIYAIPPCIRLTSLGMREVPFAPRGGDLVRCHQAAGDAQGAAAAWFARRSCSASTRR